MRSCYAPLLLALLGFAAFASIAFWRAQQPIPLEQPVMRTLG